MLGQVEKRPELLRRENFICHDGLPYDYEAVMRDHVGSGAFGQGGAVWLPTKGPTAWGTSQLLQQAFDALAGYPSKRNPLDVVQPEIVSKLKSHLEHESIRAVCTMADKTMAHAERLAKDSDAAPLVTYAMVDEALRNIVQVASFLSSHLFSDAAFGSFVPVPQFDVLAELDRPWIRTENLPALHAHWQEVSDVLGKWADDSGEAFLPSRPKGGGPNSYPGSD